MAYQTISHSVNHVLAHPVVPVFYHDNPAICKEVVRVCYDAGIRVFEFTNRGPQAAANFASLRQMVSSQCPGLALGIGTIFTYRTAAEFLSIGCDFVVSPALVPEMKQIQTSSYTLWIPGCATVSELSAARDLNAQMMKVFPANLLGPGFLAAALSVMPELKLMPTGGIEPAPDSLSRWFQAGAAAIGMGSQLISKEILDKQDWNRLHDVVSQVVQGVRQLKKK